MAMNKRSLAAAAMMAMVAADPETLKQLQRQQRIPKGSTPNKYQPHQGAREKARRLRRMKLADVIGKACVLLMLLFASVAQAQTADPATLPLVQAADLQYVGGFRVPDTSISNTDLSYGGRGLAFDPQRRSLFIGSVWNRVAEITIPAGLVNSTNPMAMPQASYAQNAFIDPTEGNMAGLYDGSVLLGGLLARPGRLTVTAAIQYDAMGTAQVSHFARSTSLTTPSFSGWSKVWDKPGFVAGYQAEIPAEHQARLGGTALTGACCLSIISRTSFGPAAFAFDPSQVGQPNVSATPLLYYPMDHPTLGPWEGSNPNFGATTFVGGVVIPPGTRSALFFGRNGMGPYCYGDGTADKAFADANPGWCYDPTNSSKGQHGYPYRYQVWAYDLNDLAAVKRGEKQPWDVLPYAVWPLDLPLTNRDNLGGVTFDAQTKTIYVSQVSAQIIGCCGVMPVIHAFTVKNSTTPTPEPVPTPTPPPDQTVDALKAEVAKLSAQLTKAQGDLATVTGSLNTSNAQVSALTAQRDEAVRILQASVAHYGQLKKNSFSNWQLADLHAALAVLIR